MVHLIALVCAKCVVYNWKGNHIVYIGGDLLFTSFEDFVCRSGSSLQLFQGVV